MGESTEVPASLTKVETYRSLKEQITALLANEPDATANMANFCAAIHHVFKFHWTGIYRVVGGQLVLGPFQGPVACTRIGEGKGVCGTAWSENRTIRVKDVEAFPGHIACSPLSRSELVVPIRRNGTIIAVLDIDSTELDAFDEEDQIGIENLVTVLESHL
jgi:GAF domain-containing protein